MALVVYLLIALNMRKAIQNMPEVDPFCLSLFLRQIKGTD